mgnify:CR=1 FL=1
MSCLKLPKRRLLFGVIRGAPDRFVTSMDQHLRQLRTVVEPKSLPHAVSVTAYMLKADMREVSQVNSDIYCLLVPLYKRFDRAIQDEVMPVMIDNNKRCQFFVIKRLDYTPQATGIMSESEASQMLTELIQDQGDGWPE